MKNTQKQVQDFSHIKDSYFREKLEKGLIPYEPKEWAINQLDPMEENGGGRK